MGEREFARAIRRRRDILGLSQARLGVLVGRSASTIRNWERGRSLPSTQADVRTLAAVLGVDERKLMADAGFDVATDDVPPSTETRPTMEQVYASLSTAELERLEIDTGGEAEAIEPEEAEAPDEVPLDEEVPPDEVPPDETPADDPPALSDDEPVRPDVPASELVPEGADELVDEPVEEPVEEPAEEPAEEPPAVEEAPISEEPVPADVEDPIPAAVVEASAREEPTPVDAEDSFPGAVEEADAEEEVSAPPTEPDPPAWEPQFEAAPDDVVAPEEPWVADAGVPPSLDWARPDGPAPSGTSRRLGRAAPPTVLERAPAGELSYLEDPQERQRYRLRALVTAALVVGLVIVLLWSFDRATDILGSLWDDITGMLSV